MQRERADGTVEVFRPPVEFDPDLRRLSVTRVDGHVYYVDLSEEDNASLWDAIVTLGVFNGTVVP